MHEAADRGHLEIVKILCEKKADVNSLAGLSRYTPLHFAARSMHECSLEIVQCLCENGANIEAMTHAKKTPAELAIKDDIRNYLHDCRLEHEASRTPDTGVELKVFSSEPGGAAQGERRLGAQRNSTSTWLFGQAATAAAPPQTQPQTQPEEQGAASPA